MANHKRKRPKHQRSGCLFCKGHKHEGRAKEYNGGARRRDEATKADLREATR